MVSNILPRFRLGWQPPVNDEDVCSFVLLLRHGTGNSLCLIRSLTLLCHCLVFRITLSHFLDNTLNALEVLLGDSALINLHFTLLYLMLLMNCLMLAFCGLCMLLLLLVIIGISVQATSLLCTKLEVSFFMCSWDIDGYHSLQHLWYHLTFDDLFTHFGTTPVWQNKRWRDILHIIVRTMYSIMP